jgi:hypothetical protein
MKKDGEKNRFFLPIPLKTSLPPLSMVHTKANYICTLILCVGVESPVTTPTYVGIAKTK